MNPFNAPGIPPEEEKRLQAKVKRLQQLARRIDRGYARRNYRGILAMETEAERLEEELEALYHYYMEDDAASEGHSVDELLLATYRSPERFGSRQDWLDNMKETLRLALHPYTPDLPISDQEILNIAQDLDLRRRDLLARYRKRTP